MKDLFKLILGVLPSLFRSRARLEAEILILRQQIGHRNDRVLNNTDRFLFVWLYHWFLCVLKTLSVLIGGENHTRHPIAKC